MDLLRLLVGAALLTLGRRLFWLFVAGLGFVAGLRLAGAWFSQAPDWVMLAIGLLAGLIGAGIALLLQRLGIALAGFLAGAYIVSGLLELLGVDPGATAWIAYLVGGVIGAVLLSALFDWALIILSSISGALIMLQALDLTTASSTVLFLVLVVIGVLVQRRIGTAAAP
jgi:hypothetical protein